MSFMTPAQGASCGKLSWVRLMCVQITQGPCPCLSVLPAGNLFLLKIWVNSKHYTAS